MNSVSESVSGKWSKTKISPQSILKDLLSMNNVELPGTVEYNPDLKVSGSMKITITQSSDGTLLFTRQALYKLVATLLVVDNIEQLKDFPVIEYGDVRRLVVYGQVKLGSKDREFLGQREKFILPIRAYSKLNNIEVNVAP